MAPAVPTSNPFEPCLVQTGLFSELLLLHHFREWAPRGVAQLRELVSQNYYDEASHQPCELKAMSESAV
eukprot:6072220-Amphidinium_carterae.1